jgi:type I restriction enzyme S subunit
MDSNWINAGGIIPSGWELVPLKDLLLNDKAISVGVMYPGEHLDGGIPLIKVGDVSNGEILKAPDSRISPIVDEEYKRTRLVGNELLITLVGNPGECVIVEPHMKGWNAARALAVLRFKNPEIRHWLKLIIQSKPSRHIIDSRLNTTVQKTLNLKDVKELPVLMPSEKIRDSLCCYYYTLEHKSTLNRQINQTLEQMAQALFKSWFVDFDPVVDNALDAGFFEQDLAFPDELLRRAEARRAVREHGDFKPLPKATRQLFPAAFEECAEPSVGLGGWVPQGWTVQTCEEISDKIGMGPFGSNIKVSTFVEDGVPVISGTHLKQVLLEEHDYNYITEEHALKLKNSCVYKGDIVFTHAGNIGQVSLVPLESQYEKYMISQRQFYLRPNHRKIKSSYLVYFFHSTNGQHKLLSNASQTGVPSIARPSTHLKSICLLVPHMDVQDVFDTYIAAWNKKIMKSRENVISLTRLRDTLLPKLISGELRLDNIEADFAKEGVA